jgi:hypothetical protein
MRLNQVLISCSCYSILATRFTANALTLTGLGALMHLLPGLVMASIYKLILQNCVKCSKDSIVSSNINSSQVSQILSI